MNDAFIVGLAIFTFITGVAIISSIADISVQKKKRELAILLYEYVVTAERHAQQRLLMQKHVIKRKPYRRTYQRRKR